MANDNHGSHNANLPAGWVWTTIGDVVLRMSNGTTANQSKEKEGIPVTRIETIATGVIDLERVGYTDLPNEAREKYRLLYGDILFSHINSDSHLGKTALFKLDNQLLLHGMNLLLLRPNTAVVAPEYLHYLCNHYRFSGKFAAVAQHAVNQSSINQAKLKQIPFPLAPLPEQHRIVAKIEEQFTRLDAGVAALKRAQANLKRYKAAVLKAACEGRLVAQDASDEPASELLKRILAERRAKWAADLRAKGKDPQKAKYEEPQAPDLDALPELPKGWCWASAEQCTRMITDGEHITPERSDSGVFLLSARNVQDGWLSLENVDYISESVYEALSRRLVIEPGDVLLSCSGSVGRSCVAPENVRFALVRSVAVLKPLSQMGKFLSVALRSPVLQNQINEKKTQTAQANIFQNKIRKLVFPVPPLTEQRRIVADVERRLSVVQELEATFTANLARAERLRQSILKRAFEGKL